MDISLAKAKLVALFLESLLYGVFLTLYLISLSILLAKTGTRQITIPVATLLLCIATADLIIGFIRTLEAFVFNVQTVSADTYHINLTSSLDLRVAHSAIYVTQTALADAIIIWRCYVVNHRSLWVAIPGCIAVLTNATIGCYFIWTFSWNHSGSAVPTTAERCITAFYVSTLIISITCTSVIAWRIYRTRSFMPGGSRSLLPVFIVIIETGALYAISVLALLITFLTGSDCHNIVLNIIVPTVGIAFCLVILQVHFQIGRNHPTEQLIEPKDIISDHFRARDGGDIGSILGCTTVSTTARITEETEIEIEIETETEIVLT